MLKLMILRVENNNISKYIESLSLTEVTDYSLWKATKKMHPQTNHYCAIKQTHEKWRRSNVEIADAFSCHLIEVFIIQRSISQYAVVKTFKSFQDRS